MKRKIYCLILLTAVNFVACRKKDDATAPTAPGLKIQVKNFAGTQPLSLNTSWYITDAGDSLKVTELKYYITNVTLYTDNSQFSLSEDDHLIDESDAATRSWTIENIPTGIYKKMSFLIGVDARRNNAGAQTGALDPSQGMFWDWNTGYIMAKLEGVSPNATSIGNKVSYHIAGYKGEQSVIRNITLNFPSPIEIGTSGAKTVHINADILEWFKTPELIKLADLPSIATLGADAVKIADNYADMFTIDRID